MEHELCWCGSGKIYADCHKNIDDKIAEFKARGCEVPDRDMIKTPEQIAGIRKACDINTAVLDLVAEKIKTGMTTEEIDRIVYDYTISQGATPAPLGFCGFPKSVCTSINDQVCHGIPSPHDVLRSGDIVNVDVSTIYNGYYADASRMFTIGKVDKKAKDLVEITKECLKRGIEAAQPWGFLGDIGAAVSAFAKKHGYSVVTEFGGNETDFGRKVIGHIIGACLNKNVIAKEVNEIHAVIHAAEEAARGFLASTSIMVNVALKIAVVRHKN